MLYRIKTRTRPVKLLVDIKTDEPRDLVFIGRDADRKNTGYFERNYRTEPGINKLEFDMPQSPNILSFNVYDWFDSLKERLESSKFFEVDSIGIEPLELEPWGVSESTEGMIKFIRWFADNAGTLRPKTYRDKYGILTISYVDDIYADNGDVHPTPARITIDGTNIVEISKAKFDKATVPGRVAILTHEIAHNFIAEDPDDEYEADEIAVRLFMRMGYPSIEFYYAFAKIFNNRDSEQLERLQTIIHKIKQEKDA